MPVVGPVIVTALLTPPFSRGIRPVVFSLRRNHVTPLSVLTSIRCDAEVNRIHAEIASVFDQTTVSLVAGLAIVTLAAAAAPFLMVSTQSVICVPPGVIAWSGSLKLT